MAECKPVLYSYFRSSCSYRVRISLAYKGIDYEYKAVNLLTREHLEDNFSRANPFAQVPALIHDGNILTHSNAILEYLEEVVPQHPLLPRDPVARARVRAIVDSIVSDIQPLQNMRVLTSVGQESAQTWGKKWIERGFSAVERFLLTTRGLYCVGDSVTLADVCLVPQVFNADRFKVDMSQFPVISEIASRLSELPAFKAAHPFVQPDCPDELRQ